MTEPVTLKSNEYWGARSGSISAKEGRIFKIKNWGGGTNNSRTPGVRSRRERNYANPKLQRKRYSERVTKGQKHA